MEIAHCFHSQPQWAGFALQEMAAFLPVFREEVEVISGNAKCTRETGRPQSDQRPTHICEGKFSLRFGCVHQPRTFSRWTHRPGSNPVKPAVEAQGIKNIARGSQRVTAPLQLTEVSDWFHFYVHI